MIIEVFWNKAIATYCLKNQTKVIFVPISSDNIELVYNEYLEKIEGENLRLIIQSTTQLGGIEKSYFESIKRVFNLQKFEEYSFLKFSFFVYCSFQMTNASSFWETFNNTLFINTNLKLATQNRKPLIESIIGNLKRYCSNSTIIEDFNLPHNVEFLELNIYGEDASRKNVGRFYAHSIFNSKSISIVKKSLYELGYAYTIPLESLTEENFTKILEPNSLTRIRNLFKNDSSTKELIHECLKLWLVNWKPSEKEEIDLVRKRVNKITGKINVSRIWINKKQNKKIEWEYGFVTPLKLGNEGKIHLDQEEEIYIDLENSFKIKENTYLYLIVNYANKKSSDLT